MRRTVFIADDLLEEAHRVLGTTSVRDTVEAGLREAIRWHRLQALRYSFGQIDLDLTAEEPTRLRGQDECPLP